MIKSSAKELLVTCKGRGFRLRSESVALKIRFIDRASQKHSQVMPAKHKQGHARRWYFVQRGRPLARFFDRMDSQYTKYPISINLIAFLGLIMFFISSPWSSWYKTGPRRWYSVNRAFRKYASSILMSITRKNAPISSISLDVQRKKLDHNKLNERF